MNQFAGIRDAELRVLAAADDLLDSGPHEVKPWTDSCKRDCARCALTTALYSNAYDLRTLRASRGVSDTDTDAAIAWREVEAATAVAAVLFQAMVRKNMALRNLVEEGNSYREFSKDFPFRAELESALAECANVPAIDDPNALLEHVRAAARAEGAKAERERCLRLCNGVADSGDFTEGAAEACAHAIRADWSDK